MQSRSSKFCLARTILGSCRCLTLAILAFILVSVCLASLFEQPPSQVSAINVDIARHIEETSAIERIREGLNAVQQAYQLPQGYLHREYPYLISHYDHVLWHLRQPRTRFTRLLEDSTGYLYGTEVWAYREGEQNAHMSLMLLKVLRDGQAHVLGYIRSSREVVPRLGMSLLDYVGRAGALTWAEVRRLHPGLALHHASQHL